MRKNSSCVPWKEDPSSIKGAARLEAGSKTKLQLACRPTTLNPESLRRQQVMFIITTNMEVVVVVD